MSNKGGWEALISAESAQLPHGSHSLSTGAQDDTTPASPRLLLVMGPLR